MDIECPLCGRKRTNNGWDTIIPEDIIEIQNQIENLDRALLDLLPQEGSLLVLIENRVEMCPICQALMDGIESEEDRKTLEERINQQVEELEEIVQQKEKGKE